MALSDTLTLLRNASLSKHTSVLVPKNKYNIEIISALIKESYLKKYSEFELIPNFIYLIVYLEYFGWWYKKPVFSKLDLVSKPGKRVYYGYKELEKNMLNITSGTFFLSTSAGIIGHVKALDLKIGGEVICYAGF